jgi:hypothetical protein
MLEKSMVLSPPFSQGRGKDEQIKKEVNLGNSSIGN